MRMPHRCFSRFQQCVFDRWFSTEGKSLGRVFKRFDTTMIIYQKSFSDIRFGPRSGLISYKIAKKRQKCNDKSSHEWRNRKTGWRFFSSRNILRKTLGEQHSLAHNSFFSLYGFWFSFTKIEKYWTCFTDVKRSIDVQCQSVNVLYNKIESDHRPGLYNWVVPTV